MFSGFTHPPMSCTAGEKPKVEQGWTRERLGSKTKNVEASPVLDVGKHRQTGNYTVINNAATSIALTSFTWSLEAPDSRSQALEVTD